MIHNPCFSSTAFFRGTNFLIAFVIGTRSFVQIFQIDVIFFFSLAFWCKRFSRSFFINLGINEVPIKLIQWIYIRWGRRPFFGTDQTSFNFVLRKSCTKCYWWDGAAYLANIQSSRLTTFSIAGNNSLRKCRQ